MAACEMTMARNRPAAPVDHDSLSGSGWAWLWLITFDVWMRIGYRNGYVAGAYCATHEPVPMTADEEAAFRAGDGPCVPALRPCLPDLDEEAL